MKYCKEKLKECIKWIEKNGLDQHGGATIASFCAAQDITFQTYCRWKEKSEFCEAIERAKEVFRDSLEETIYASLKTRAVGYDTRKTKTEFVEDKQGNVKIKKRTTEEMHVNGDTGAAIFLLTNIAPERWANTQRNELTGGLDVKNTETPMSLEELNSEIERLSKAE